MGKLIFSPFLRGLMVRRIEIYQSISGIGGGRCCLLATWLNNSNIGREEVLVNGTTVSIKLSVARNQQKDVLCHQDHRQQQLPKQMNIGITSFYICIRNEKMEHTISCNRRTTGSNSKRSILVHFYHHYSTRGGGLYIILKGILEEGQLGGLELLLFWLP